MSRKKRNDQLRSKKDARNRKKPTDGVTWAQRLFDELTEGEQAQDKPTGKRKGKRDNSKRLRGDHR